MMENIRKAEILAPAGDNDMLVAAVRSGADAVYLGAKDFSARRNAENFGKEELKKAIEYCHIRGVRVYLTLNIVIKENEFENAFLLARDAYNMGIDGIIVQDLGLARVLSEKIPELTLHASTQMSVHSPSALLPLKKLGFTQVVVAREMSKEEIREICKKAKELRMTVEVFVHGALCMSVSGQCLLSAFLGGRSGNRGLCAGPCRLPFKANGGTGYDLSLKDLSLLQYIKELYEMGVTSFKIEGRMKRPEYVAAATNACRQALDNGIIETEFENTLKNVFSRSGFTAGYYEQKLGRDMFGIRTKDDVLASDTAFSYLHTLYRNERKNVPVSVKAKILKNEPISLSLSDGENTVTAFGNIPQTAQNRAVTYDDVLKNITKFGATPYYDEGGGVSLDDGIFVSAGELNSLRRTACEMLDNERAKVKSAQSDAVYIKENKVINKLFKNKLYIRAEKKEQIPENLEGIDAVIYPLENEPVIFNDNILHIVDIPRGIISEDLIAKRLWKFKEKGYKSCLCGNLAAIEIAKKLDFGIFADTGLNITNSESLKTAESFGVSAAVMSCEEFVEDLEKLPSAIEKGIITYGNIPLMLFKNCPLKNGKSCDKCDKNGTLTDRKGIEFPVRCRMGYSELLNSVPIWMADKRKDTEKFDFSILYFTKESPDRVKEVIEAYKKSLAPDTPHTRGLYYRGTI